MFRTKRQLKTSRKLDLLEQSWWDKNAKTIARVWQLDEKTSWIIRKDYTQKAKKFFMGKKKTVKILEIGCGSGWVGQLIAGPNMYIIGTDYSHSQIRLARENASKKGLERYCQYQWIDSVKELKKTHLVDGILIHAFLHHLNGEEIENFFKALHIYFPYGTKIWIYEPTFYSSKKNLSVEINWLTNLCLKIANFLFTTLQKIYLKNNLINQDVTNDFLSLTKRAQVNNWYLSPKEVPFDCEDFSNRLTKEIQIKDHYWATIRLISWVWQTSLLKNHLLRIAIQKTVLPFWVLTDKLLAREKKFLRYSLVAPNYAFHVWEGILK